MIKAGHVSSILSNSLRNLVNLEDLSQLNRESLMAMIVTNDGQLLSSSVANSSSRFDSCQKLAAVSASIAEEYRAVDRLMKYDFRSVVFSTENLTIQCTHFCSLKDSGSVLLTVAVPSVSGLCETSRLGLVRSLSKRLCDDLLPSLRPVMENMISAPPTE